MCRCDPAGLQSDRRVVEKEVGGRIKRARMILHCQLHSWLFNSTNHRQAAFTAQGCFVPPVLKAPGKRGKRGKGMVQIKQPSLSSLSTRSLHHSWLLFAAFHSNVVCVMPPDPFL